MSNDQRAQRKRARAGVRPEEPRDGNRRRTSLTTMKVTTMKVIVSYVPRSQRPIRECSAVSALSRAW